MCGAIRAELSEAAFVKAPGSESEVAAHALRDVGEDGPNTLIEASRVEDTEMIVIRIRNRPYVDTLFPEAMPSAFSLMPAARFWR